jgi:hypothetical protein
MVTTIVLFIVATIAFLDDDDDIGKGRERKMKRKKRKGRQGKERVGTKNINMVLPFIFWKFFFHNFKVPRPYLASIPKRVFTPKIIAKSQNVQARNNET